MGLGTKAFDPAQAIFTLGGIEIKGYAPGSKIAASFPELYNMVVGLDGEVARGKTNNKTSQWKVSLLQTSVSNRTLMTLFSADDSAPGGTIFPLFYKNLTGDTIITAASAWIVGYPEYSITAEVGVNEWTIQCGETITYIGGQDALA
jgi:hypothetical protein